MFVLRSIPLCRFCSTPPALQTAQKYIQENVQSKQWIHYMQGKYLPNKIRPAFYAMHWLNHQLSKIPLQTRDTSLALGKIRFWQDNIDSIYAGKLPNAQPISISLRHQCQVHPISKIHFDRLIQARIFETNFRTINTVNDFISQCEKMYSSIIIATLQMLQVPINDMMVETALEVGRAVGICHYIKQTPYILRANRLYLPQQINEKHNINLNNIWERVKGEPREELFDSILEIAAFAKQYLASAKKKQKDLPLEAFRAYLGAIETELYLQQLEKANFNVFSQSLNRPSVIKFTYRLHSAARKGNFIYN